MIGVLALQGAFAKHLQVLRELGVLALEVRTSKELSLCDGLIIPGGESTTMAFQIKEKELQTPLKEFASSSPIFGTCAGMILMAQGGPLPILPLSVERNAYGRQKDSFLAPISSTFFLNPIEAFFIRAPRITALHSPDIQILASYKGDPILVRYQQHLAASFHPELTNDPQIHQYFIQLCKQKQSPPQQLKTIPTKSFQMI